MATLQPYKKYNSVAYDYATELPDGWQLWKIAHAFNLIGSGTTPQSGNISFYESGTINWINTGDLNDGVINECKNKITELAFKKHSVLKIYPKGTLLVAMYGATIGKAAVMNLEGCTNQACCALSKSKILTNKFTLYWFIANRKNIVNLSYGGGQPNISQDVIKKLKIPVPPLGVQNSIVAYLDKKNSEIDKFIRNKERLVAILEERKKDVIDTTFTKGLNPNVEFKATDMDWLVKIPTNWNLKRLKFLTKIISKGSTPSTEGREMTTEGIRFLKAENIFKSLVTEEPAFFIDEGTHRILKRSQLKEYDLLFVIAGATIGKVAILQKEFIPANTNQAVSFIRLKKKVDVEFCYYWLHSNFITTSIWLKAVTSAQPNLAMEDLGNLSIPYPSDIEKEEIVKYVKDEHQIIDLAISKAQKEISSIKEYREALITDLVTGKRSLNCDLE